MSLEEKTSHVVEAQANFVEQFKVKPRLDALVQSWVGQIQELEPMFFDILEDTLVSTSVGEQLDELGTVVGELRQARTDDEYRIAIGARILINTSNGTIEEMIAIALALTGGGLATVEIVESFPAAFTLTITTPLAATLDPFSISTALQSAKPAAVRLIFIFKPLGILFAFDGKAGSAGLDDGKFIGATDF